MDLVDARAQPIGVSLRVRLVPLPHNWIKLPQSYVNHFLELKKDLQAVFRLKRVATDADEFVVAWNGLVCHDPGCIEIPQALASGLGLHDGDVVDPEHVTGLPYASLVHVTVSSADDWAVIESNAASLTTALLQQLKVIRKGDTVPIWIRGQSSVDVRVETAEPADTVILTNDSIVSVEPPAQVLPDEMASGAIPDLTSDADGTRTPKLSTSGKSEPQFKFSTPAIMQGPMRLRVRAWSGRDLDLVLKLPAGTVTSTFTVAVFINEALAKAYQLQQGKVYNVKKSADAASSSCPAMPVFSHASVPHGHICMAPAVMHHLALPENSQVWLEPQYTFAATADRINTMTVQHLKPFSNAEEDEEEAAAARRAAALLADNKDDTPRDDEAEVYSFVERACAQGCEPVLRAAGLTAHGRALRAVLDEGDEAAAFNPLSKGNGAVDLETTVQKPLHTFLAAWIDAACSFQEAVVPPDSSDGGFNASPTLTLTLPKATVITLEGAGLPPATFLLTLLAAGSGYKQFKFTRSSAEQAVRAKPVAFSAPLQFPVSNPIMCVRSWAREIFWQPPPHARAAVLAAEPGLVPRGKGWLDKELTRALEVAMPYLALRSQHFWKDATVPAPGGILVSGGRGSGKSALLERCAAFLGSHPMTMCHVSRMPCRSMAGDKMKRIAKWLQNCLVTSLMHAPAVVLMDDVDALIPVIPEHAPPQEQHMIEFFNEFLASVFDWMREKVTETGAQVLIIASCSDAGKLPKLLRATGRLDHLIEVGTPNTAERRGMIEHMLRLRGLSHDASALEGVARRMEGFDAADLAVVIERAAQQVRLEALAPAGARRGAAVDAAHWDAALAHFQPSAAWEAGAQETADASVTGWKDVGGMGDAKEALYEALELPLRFAKLVAKAPLRLRTGVLLYGPPGCGKTHAVRAAVAATGVRFIGVKGPELLNKYIGASEEAVRAVFARAQAAAPCALFFDEFDSIAPQRGSGSDSTGVTERMVNQLLTELDGVERLQGVCVIAASNRPDLIDAALLRPGRLDRLIYCGFPTRDERLDILTSLFAKVKHGDGVSYTSLADETEGFSGADLRAIVSEAQLSAVMAHLERLKAAEAAGGAPDKHAAHETPLVSAADVAAALENARPSLSAADRKAMEGRFTKFRKTREGQKVSPFSSESEAARKAMVDSSDSQRVALG